MGYKNVVKREILLSRFRGDFFTQWLGLPVSLPITRFFLHFNISENLATLLMWAVGITGAVLIAIGGALKSLGLLLVVFHYILDYVDGQLARERKTSSILGSVMDRWSHFTVQMSFFFCIGIVLYREYNSATVFIPVFIFLFWNQFRNLIVNIPYLIYCNELKCYHSDESSLIYNNYCQSLKQDLNQVSVQTEKVDDENVQHIKPLWRVHIRAASTSFDFLVISLFIASVVEVVLNALGIDIEVFLYTIYLFSFYYIYNFIDYSRQYLFSKHIYQIVSEVEKKLDKKETV